MADETIIEVTPADIKAREEMIGRKFEHLTVIGALDEKVIKYKARTKFRQWLCKCDCGRERIVRDDILKRGGVTNCGDKNCKFKRTNLIDLTGQRFGKLVVLRKADDTEKLTGQSSSWVCKCDCGNTTVVRSIFLRNGETKSCGCAKSSLNGGSKSPLYSRWRSMIRRCESSKDNGYKDYGGRGISVCNDWHNFDIFEKWAYENGYSKSENTYDCTLDRIDVDGNYCPENCRWIGMKGQCNNRRSNHYIELNGIIHTLKEWAEIYNIDYRTVKGRLHRGWSEYESLTIPSGHKRSEIVDQP